MATTTHIEEKPRVIIPRAGRGNEILAILFIALGLLLTLCLVSATFYPNDPSWNSAGQTETQNWAGSIGANVAAMAFQSIGLAAFLLPLLLFAAAWRRFHTGSIHRPWTRVVGLVVLVVAAAALLSISHLRPLFDSSVQPGGLLGAIVAQGLASGLSNVGATVLLVAIAATGLLLATNFSFVRLYEIIVSLIRTRFAFVGKLPERFKAWQQMRAERVRLKKETKAAIKAEREAARSTLKQTLNLTPAERVADFMKEQVATEPPPVIRTEASRTAIDFVEPQAQATAAAASASAAGAGVAISPATVVTGRSGRRSIFPIADVDDEKGAEEMVKGASVLRVNTEQPATGKLPFDATRRVNYSDYGLPPLEFLNEAPPHSEQADTELLSLATRLAEKCKEFNVTGQIKHICPGPVVTTYEFKPDPGVKYSRVVSLVDDLCLALKAESIRIDRMPGKPHVGIEVPNPRRETIFLREVIESRPFRESGSKLTIALGKTIDGLNYVADLAKMPHLLIAGTTGSGKSVGVNALIVSILYRARPDEVKFILIDPKRLELGLYEDIPHLAAPIIVDPKLASRSLKWAVGEMERRYRDLAGWGVRNIDGYNTEIMRRNLVKEYDDKGEPWKPLPYIVIIIDELADLMMTSGREVEESITRLAQMARAVGIHLVLATQRPSVDVITGLIKANFPSRISFRVSSKIDSRTIIDTNGAEQLLGRGDMLFLPPGTSRLIRVHGAYIDETEIGRIVSHIKAQGPPSYDESITQSDEEALGLESTGGEHDELFEEALRICVEMKRASTSVLQRRLRIGYGRAAAILDIMEREGLIGQADGSRPRPVLGRAYEMVADWDEMAASDV
ncbi:MAG TPA: DNA translocase FtsK 4TM domain-containing protein [Pyrinomonadaceae bacterium]|jgi:S-DNA-T family DNA segregation ATPase FtsK/SpoIIIE|nr:DNA translocase FtsK 4TM domain-containing protein [Pyrinomonadaceae bacterium]